MISHLIFNCMFVVQNKSEEILNNNFHDKKLPTGSATERTQNSNLLICFAALRATSHTNFFNMQKKKEIVANTDLSRECVELCLHIKEMGSKKEVDSKLFHVFTDAHNNQTSEINGFFETGHRYELFKSLRELLSKVGKMKKESLEQLLQIED